MGTGGAPGFRSRLNSQAKTALRALAIGVMVVGALSSFTRTADANVALFGPGAPEGHYLGFMEGNSSGSESEDAIFSILNQPTNPTDHPNIIENQLLFYAKVDQGTSGTSSPGPDSPLGSLTTTFTGASSGTWSFSPLNDLQEVTLLAIKAGNYFGLWLYQQFTPGQDPQTGTFDAAELYVNLQVLLNAGQCNGCGNGIPAISHIEVFGDLNVIPLPAALPLYGTGLAVMGFLGWRRKRKAAA